MTKKVVTFAVSISYIVIVAYFGQGPLTHFFLGLASIVVLPVALTAILIAGAFVYLAAKQLFSYALSCIPYTTRKYFERLWKNSNHLKQFLVDPKYAANQTLIQACYDRDLVKIQEAIAKGANVNAKDDTGLTPLWIMISHSSDTLGVHEIIKYLFLKGADPTIKDPEGKNALHAVIVGGITINLLPLFKLANQKQGYFDECYRNRTPLMSAVDKIPYVINYAHIEKIIKSLLELKADPNKNSLYEGDNLIPGPNYNGDEGNGIPLISLIKELEKQVITPQPGINNIEHIHSICMMLLDKGAKPNPTIQWTVDGVQKETTIDYISTHVFPQHPLLDDVVNRCRKIMGGEFIIPENIAKTNDTALLNKTIQDAVNFQDIRELTDLFILEKNCIALNCMEKLIKPETPGYAYFHSQMAQANMDSLKHYIQGSLSQEQTDAAKESVANMRFMLRNVLGSTQADDVLEEVAISLVKGLSRR